MTVTGERKKDNVVVNGDVECRQQQRVNPFR